MNQGFQISYVYANNRPFITGICLGGGFLGL